MKHLIRVFLAILLANISTAHAQNGELDINGIASFEQLRKEYYVGALYLGWPGRDQAAIANMPGKKRMEIHITADRWPALRFSQMWNQLITINNPSAMINSNAMDVVAFTSIPKGDLVEGDQLTIELTGNNTTQVSLNGVTALRTENAVLFSMLLNTWIGQRPPTSEFKRDILETPKDSAELLARFNSIKPSDARRKAVAGWGLKAEPEAVATAATPTAVAAVAPAIAARPVVPPSTAPAPSAAPTAPKKTEPAVAAKPQPEEKPKDTSAPIEVATAAPTPAAPATDEAKARQKAMYNEYVGQIRKLVIKNIDYPKRAIKESIEGLVMIRVTVDRAGNLAGMDILQPADDLLDAAAQKAVEKAAPFPKPADDVEGTLFVSQIPIVFKLTQ